MKSDAWRLGVSCSVLFANVRAIEKELGNDRQGKVVLARLKRGIRVAAGLGLLLREKGNRDFETAGVVPRPAAKRGHEARRRERSVAANKIE